MLLVSPSIWRTPTSSTSRLFVRAFAFTASSPRSSRLGRLNHHQKYPISATRLQVSTNPLTNGDKTFATMTNGVAVPEKYEFTEADKYLFDLNGYVIVRGVLSPEEIQEVNQIVDKHEGDMVERMDQELRNAAKDSALYGTGPGRKDLGRCLEWGADSRIFKSVLAHPKLVPFFHGILGKGYRMDHLPFIIAQDKGAEGFQLHGGTIDCVSGEYNPHLAYSCNHGMIRSNLLGCNVMLVDHNEGDGGFCVVAGSHKANFKMPKGMVDGEEQYSDFIRQPATKAGDVVLFSEGTVHGAMAWTAVHQRRACLYRFAPATNAYGRSYFGHEGGGWPKGIYDDLTETEKAVLEPPFANRLDRPNIADDGSVEMTTRNERKKQHDRDVFGTKYF